MPRLSLFRPEKGQDYKFLDRQVSEMFQVGGTDVHLHKYIGTYDGTTFKDHTQIQDLVFLENRDRKYDKDIYRIRGHYQVQDIDFNLSQFGLFLDNDMVYMTVHINDFISAVGRKPMPGDVFELPHLKDDFAFNVGDLTLARYFVIEDVGRAAEGFSMTWWPHLYRLKLKKITAGQQYDDILNTPTDTDVYVGDYDPAKTYQVGQIVRYEGVLYTVTTTTTGNAPPDANYFSVYGGNTLLSVLSDASVSSVVNNAIISEAEENTPLSGYETQHFYTLAVDPTTGKPELRTADETDIDVSQLTSRSPDASAIHARPQRSGYTGYLLGDGIPDNGVTEFGHGISFPSQARDGDYFLRTDFYPNRLFRYDGVRWIKKEDAVRHTLTNTDDRQTLKTSFINNTNTSTINNEVVEERQSLSKALKPKADF